MIIRQFMVWTRHASASRRAEATTALTRAYLYGDLGADEAWEAKTALLALLDDPSPVVRAALAEACADSARTPRPIVVALSCDVPEVATPVLARSPVLTEADLVDAAALADEPLRAVIARRHHLSHAVFGALAEVGGADTLTALALNPTARITTGRLLRMVERGGAEASLREALLARPDLPLEVRHAIGLAVAAALSTFVAERGWLGPARCERMASEAGERAALEVCDGAGAAAVVRLVRHLRAHRRLNAGLILRAVLTGRTAFAEAALSDLSGLDHAAVARAMGEPRGVADLHRRAGLPDVLLPAMQAALSARQEVAADAGGVRGASLARRMIERAIAACEDMPAAEMRAVTALLTRFEAEAARDEAREAARAILADAAAREADRRETAEANAAWRIALAAQRPAAAASQAAAPRETVLPAAETTAAATEALRRAMQAASALATVKAAESASSEVEVVEGMEAGRTAASEAAARTAEVQGIPPEQATSQAAAHALNPVGAILDALSGQILDQVSAGRTQASAGAIPPGASRSAAVDAVLDDLGAGLLQQYRADRAAGEGMRLAA